MKHLFTITLILFICVSGFAQMNINGTIKYGHEWIDYDKTYYKIEISEDGIYRMSYEELAAAGVNTTDLSGSHLKMIHNGEEVALRVSRNDAWGAGDYFEFYAQKNRTEIDKHLYTNWEKQMLNPEYSLFNDYAAYFLTIDTEANNKRYLEVLNNLTNLPNPEEYYIHKETKVFSNFHYKPQVADVRYSNFVETEGFASSLIAATTFNIDAKHRVVNNINPVFHMRTGSNNPISGLHNVTITVNGEAVVNDVYAQSLVRDYVRNLDPSLVQESNTISISATGSNSKFMVPTASLSYPRDFDFENRNYWEFELQESFFNRYLEIQNFDGGAEPYLYDPEKAQYMKGILENGILKFRLLPNNSRTTYVLAHPNTAYKSITKISERTFIDYSQVDPSYMILTSKRLDSDTQGPNIVQEYADYRSSEKGGSYDVYIVHAEDIYDQYAYGIDRHNIANRNFAHHQAIIWPNLQHWFVIGKGLEYNQVRTEAQLTANGEKYHVAPFGLPGSDMLMLSDLGEANPKYGIGRIAVTTGDELSEYLEKVKQQNDLSSWPQTVEGKSWTKEIIHLSGGDPNIQQGIFNDLESMRLIAEFGSFGGHVNTFRKFSSDPIQTSLSQEIIDVINKGTSLVTFFGHSAVGTFDFSIEDPSKYDNYGKYPMILSLGCFSGNIHSVAGGISEDFVLEPQKGAIAFLAASGTAYVNTQANSGRQFYNLFGKDLYGGTLGEMIYNIYDANKDNTSVAARTLMQQLTLHGDPAIRLHPHEGSDYTVDKESVSINPGVVSTNLDDFELSFDIVNIGIGISDSINVYIQHRGPSGETIQEQTIRVLAPMNRQSISLTLMTPDTKALGKNSIEIYVDSNDEVTELPSNTAESNNRLTENTNGEGFCFYVLDNGVIPVYPNNFGIVNDACPFDLKASTNNAFLDEQTYVFEIDTTVLFNSPLRERGSVTQKGGLITYTPSVEKVDNRVYYWRVSPDSTSTEVGYLWRQSSFVYDSNGEEGWNQSHYYQFLEDDLSEINLDPATRRWEAPFDLWDYQFNFGFNTPGSAQIRVNGVNWGTLNPTNLGSFVGVHIRDPRLFSVFNDGQIPNGSINTSIDMFGFDLNKEDDFTKLINLIESAPDSSTVMIFSVIRNQQANLGIENWDSTYASTNISLFDYLENKGATDVRKLKDVGTVPFIIALKKGKGLVKQVYGDDINSNLTDIISVELLNKTGTLNTLVIGPVTNWNNAQIEWVKEESNDSIGMKMYSIDNLGIETLISETNLEELSNIDLSDLNEISAKYMKISLELRDIIDEGILGSNRTLPQLKSIRINATPLPDVLIENSPSINKDTLQQGEDLVLEIPLININSTAFDADSISFSIINTTNDEIIDHLQVDRLDAKSSKTIVYTKNTSELTGAYLITSEFNKSRNQLEENYQNNFGVVEFFVEKDQKNPILDVTFDGFTIYDGDLVSPTPEIRISNKDDNAYLLLDDPEQFELALTSPDGSIWNIPMSDPSIEFTPAQNEENNAILMFRPTLSTDGTYNLVVQSKDASGNFSGDLAFEVNFEVTNKKSISNVFNYPNPFSTSTEFVFTLTGETPPTGMMINIYTLSGKLVKQIQPEEIGPLRVGLNRTAYKWNGTDEYGEKLANGTYLYKVVHELDSYETFYTAADSYFKNGFGKMVIIR